MKQIQHFEGLFTNIAMLYQEHLPELSKPVRDELARNVLWNAISISKRLNPSLPSAFRNKLVPLLIQAEVKLKEESRSP